MTRKKIEQQSQGEKEQLIYIGPNLPGGRLSRFTVFRGGIPLYLKDLLPKISKLIVPVAALSEALARVEKAGTAEYQAYQALITSRKDV